jgi:hypothetical protein
MIAHMAAYAPRALNHRAGLPSRAAGVESMPLSLNGSCCERVAVVDQADRGGSAVADAVVTRSFDPVGVVAGPLDDPGVGPGAAPGVEVLLAGDAGHDLGEDAFLLLRGERPPGRRPGGGQ